MKLSESIEISDRTKRMDMMARMKEDYAVDYNKNVERLMRSVSLNSRKQVVSTG